MASDNRPLKTPKMELYHFDGRLLASSMEGYPIGVVSIRYKYADTEDDRCLIKIQASDARYIDFINISRNDRLYINFGYVGGNMTGRLLIVVRDIKSKYGENVTWTELECSDAATFLKLTKSQDAVTMSLIDYIKTYCLSKVNIIIKESGKVLYKQSILKRADSDLQLESVSVLAGQGYKDPFQEEGESRLVPVEYEAGFWFGTSSVREYLEKETDLVTSGRSPYVVISEKMRLCPNGPWYISGRANTLIIHNRNLGNRVYRNYIYKGEPGDLIDFTAGTKYENFEKSTATQVAVDPLSKSTHFIDAYLNILGNMRSLKDIVEDKKSTVEKKKAELKEWLYVRENGYKRYKTGQLPVEFTADGNTYPVKTWTDYDNRGIGSEELADRTTVVNPQGLVKYGEKDFNPVKVIGRAFIYSSPIQSWDEVNANMANTLREMEMEKEEAKFIVEGDPDLIIDLVVGISNVQLAHKGNYYIKECEHEISDQGYKTTLDTIKVLEEATIKTYNETGKQEPDTEGLLLKVEERYSKEEKVFRNWQIEILVKAKSATQGFEVSMGQTGEGYSQDKYIPFDEWVKSLGPDVNIEDAILQKSAPGSFKFSGGKTETNVETR